MEALKPFDIRNFTEQLTPAKEKGKYVCPVCEGQNLSISSKTGAFQCWNGCENKDIREAIRPWSEVTGNPDAHRRATMGQRRQPATRYCAPKPAPFPQGKIALLRCSPEPTPKPQAPQWRPEGVPANAEEIIYPYSPNLFVHRLQWLDSAKPKGREKTFRQCRLNSDGLPEWNKGPEPWLAYREQEALSAIAEVPADVAPILLIQEGERCVHLGLEIGLVSVTFQGSAWNRADIERFLKAMLAANPRTIVVFLVDADTTGEKKAQVVSENCNACGVPFLALSANVFLPTPQEKADIEEILANMTPDEFINRLEEEIHREIDAIRQQQTPTANADPDAQLRLEIQAYCQESDPIRKVRIKGNLCSNYRISSRDLSELALFLETAHTTPAVQKFTGKEFLLRESEGLRWLVPGLIPARGVTLLAGAPGSGKTTLAIDAAASVINGEEFLGETATKSGKILIVSSDELPCFLQDKIIERGFPQDGWDVLLNWNISQWAQLESAIEDSRPSLILIDSFASIHPDPNFDENSSQAKASIYKLEALLNKYASAAILIHHTNKNKDNKGIGRVRGSSAIAAAASCVWLLEGEGDVKTLNSPKIRGAQPFNFKIALKPGEGRWELLEDPSENSEAKSLAGRILKLFELQPAGTRLRVGEIMELMGLHEAARENLYKALQRLEQRGMLTKKANPANLRVKIYSLASDSRIDNQHKKLSQATGTSLSHSPPLSPPPPRVKVSSNIVESIGVQGLEDTGQITGHLLDTEMRGQTPLSTETHTALEEKLLDTFLSEGGGEGVPVPVDCDSQYTINQSDGGDWTIEGAIATATANAGDAIEGLAPLVLYDGDPTDEDLAELVKDMLSAVEANGKDMFDALRKINRVRWLQLAAHEIRKAKPESYAQILAWLTEVPVANTPATEQPEPPLNNEAAVSATEPPSAPTSDPQTEAENPSPKITPAEANLLLSIAQHLLPSIEAKAQMCDQVSNLAGGLEVDKNFWFAFCHCIELPIQLGDIRTAEWREYPHRDPNASTETKRGEAMRLFSALFRAKSFGELAKAIYKTGNNKAALAWVAANCLGLSEREAIWGVVKKWVDDQLNPQLDLGF